MSEDAPNTSFSGNRFSQEFLSSLIANPQLAPKVTLEEPKYLTNTFLVQNGDTYDVYPVTLEKTPKNGNFIRIEKSPPVLTNGVISFRKRSYRVSIDDLLRRRVDVRKEFTPVRSASRTGSSRSAPGKASVPDIDKFGISPGDWDELRELSNRALESQIGELLYSEDSQAPWRPSNNPEPIRSAPRSTIPTIEEDPREASDPRVSVGVREGEVNTSDGSPSHPEEDGDLSGS